MTGPASSADSSALRMALAMQQRFSSADTERSLAESRAHAKQLEASVRLEQLRAAEQKYREENNKPVYTLRLEDGTKLEVLRGGTAVGSGPRGALVLGLGKLAREAGFPEPKNNVESMLQNITMLELHYAPDDVREQTKKMLESMKKAIELLGRLVQMLREGWKSGAVPLTPLNGGNGGETLKTQSDGMRITAGSGSDRIYALSYSVIDAGAGDDLVLAGGENQIDGGAGDDRISSGGNSQVTGGDGRDTIRLWGKGTVDGGAGDDIIDAWRDAAVTGGAGNDLIRAHGTDVDAGAGDDVISGWGTIIASGAGNDVIDAHGRSRVDAGDGNDVIQSWAGNEVAAGAGDDIITAHSSTVDGGAGNDVIESRHGEVRGGAGDDVIVGGSKVDGGDGNDAIATQWDAEVSGGRGDDQILVADKTSISFGRGDGRDTVAGWQPHFTDLAVTDLALGVQSYQARVAANPAHAAAVTFNLGQGLSRSDMQVAINGDDMTLDFGGGDSVTILDFRNMSATVKFSDGSSMKLSYLASSQPAAAQSALGNLISLQA